MKRLLLIFILINILSPSGNATTSQHAKQATIAKDKIVINEDNSDILIKQFDQSRGTYVGTYHTSKDSGKFSLVYHLNPAISFSSFTDITKIATLEFDYTIKGSAFWINFLFARTSANIEKLSTTLTSSLPESKDSINTFGLGLYQRFHLFNNFFNMGNLYESIEANVTYNLISNDSISDQFSGVGLKSDFTIFYRTSPQLHYGLKFSYNLISSQNSTGLAHTISWFSLGLDLSFYL